MFGASGRRFERFFASCGLAEILYIGRLTDRRTESAAVYLYDYIKTTCLYHQFRLLSWSWLKTSFPWSTYIVIACSWENYSVEWFSGMFKVRCNVQRLYAYNVAFRSIKTNQRYVTNKGFRYTNKVPTFRNLHLRKIGRRLSGFSGRLKEEGKHRGFFGEISAEIWP